MVPNHSIIEKQSFFQVLSLDVVLGSIAVGIFGVTILDVNPNPWWWLILPSAVWVVYTLDHLLDGYKKKEKSTIYRHLFHFRKRKALGFLVILIGSVAASLSLIFLENRIIFAGIILSAFVLIYFGMVYILDKFNFNYFFKEWIIAAVYVAGIFLAPLVWREGIPSIPIVSIIVVLFLLAWLESVIISYYDYENDILNGFKSFTIAFGKKATRKITIAILALLFIILNIFLLQFSGQIVRSAVLIELFICVMLLFLILFPEQFSIQNRFRWIGESLFYIPGLIYLVSLLS